jgi:ribose transport system permease protein
VIAVITYYLLSKTVFGRYVYSVGANEDIAWLSGIKTANIRLKSFILMGFLGSVAGVVLASRLNYARVYVGSNYLFDALTAVILAGTDIRGGKGNIPSTIVGVLIIGILGNIFILAGLSYAFQQFAKGLILITAVLVNVFYRQD